MAVLRREEMIFVYSIPTRELESELLEEPLVLSGAVAVLQGLLERLLCLLLLGGVLGRVGAHNLLEIKLQVVSKNESAQITFEDSTLCAKTFRLILHNISTTYRVGMMWL